ncbi:MAG: tRNA pseudouridine(55) synthase TruB [Clostridia bacterium]|nr:tRNA pseudouridine(55) synthase TruB [Clostridia bacterium]MDD4680750.1 tRNA pseudouridine(55) synthase TruB [Clostridia bacterium]
MTGIINVLKPPGMTSSDVVVFLRRELEIKKVGHTGTLDPEAAGVLPICLGKATRISDYIMQGDKVYCCHLKLGLSTDTSDLTGNIISKNNAIPSLEKIKEALKVFQGEQNQTPPMYSAIKLDGKKLYELARKGIEVERKPRKILIRESRFLSFTPPDIVQFETTCSKGTYIRSLCRDIGSWLGCGGTMQHLIRMASGSFSLENSHTLDEILTARSEGSLSSMLIPMEQALKPIIPSIVLREECKEKISHGNSVSVNNMITTNNASSCSNKFYSIFCGDTFMGIGYISMDKDKHKIVKMKSVLI